MPHRSREPVKLGDDNDVESVMACRLQESTERWTIGGRPADTLIDELAGNHPTVRLRASPTFLELNPQARAMSGLFCGRDTRRHRSPARRSGRRGGKGVHPLTTGPMASGSVRCRGFGAAKDG